MYRKPLVLALFLAMLAGPLVTTGRADDIELPASSTLDEDELVGMDAQGERDEGANASTSPADTSAVLRQLSKDPIQHPMLTTPDDVGRALRPQLPSIGGNR